MQPTSITKNIYFYSPRSTAFKVLENHLYLNTTPLYLNSYLRRNYPSIASSIAWSKIDFFKKTQQELINQLNELKIDILCISLYIWNVDALETIQGIKDKLSRPIKIVVGGPSCDVYRDSDYFLKNPDIDYAIFSQGEHAFANVLEHEVLKKPLSTLTTKNLFWKSADKVLKSQFEFVKPGRSSPFLENRDLLEQIVNDPTHKDYVFIVPYETSKGCPHACSFCDWTAGLTHQAGHRTFDINSELNLLGSLGLVNFHPSDANFGQHKQDIEIAQTMADLKKTKGYDFYIRDTNLSKTKKNQAFEALNILLEAKIVKRAKFAIQDIHPYILKNVNRPDMPWDKHSAMIADIKKRYPESQCELELVIGLPGQTRQSWQETLIAMEGFQITAYPWMLLPNSPAGYDQEYQSRMNLKIMEVRLTNNQTCDDSVVVGSYSYDIKDFCYFMLLTRLLSWRFLRDMRPRKLLFEQVDKNIHLDSILDQMSVELTNKRPEMFNRLMRKFLDLLFVDNNNWPNDVLTEFHRIGSSGFSTEKPWSNISLPSK